MRTIEFDKEFLGKLFEQAVANPRLRQNYDLRISSTDTSQRILNALLPGTVVPIHRHEDTTETVVCLFGRLDEVLGAGASIWKWSHEGDDVEVAIMCAEAKARAFRPSDAELEGDTDAATNFVSVRKKYEATFPNIEMNTVPHLKLVQFVEGVIKESEPDIVITHHPADTNNDHLQTSMACQEAIRLFQRQPAVKPVKELWYMEVPSCSEWAINDAMNLFRPNCYVEVEQDGVQAKCKALLMYRGVMRPYPHPRSVEYITGLAAMRGSQWGCNYAEAFQVVLRKY